MKLPRKSFRDSCAEWFELVALIAFPAWVVLGIMLVPPIGLLEWVVGILVIVGLNLLAAWLSPVRPRLYALLWRRHATPLEGYVAKNFPPRPPKP